MPENFSTSVSAVDRDAPWPGLAPFTEEQSAFFHGRDEEIRALSRLMERKALTVLFGQSGLGKSSLLQAGVFPRLRAAGFCPIYIRLDHSEGAPPPAEQVKTMVAAATAQMGTWTKPGAARPGESLWEFFHHRDDRLVASGTGILPVGSPDSDPHPLANPTGRMPVPREGRTIVPVLVFDQFEELFTLGAAARSTGSGSGTGAQRDRAVAFMSELAELVENRPSEQLVARLEQSSDEMDAFDFSRTDYRICISLREDYLPHLEGLKTIMPALMENRMRLTRMTGRQALEAVLKPGAGLVSEEVARAIVEFVSGARGGSVERLAEVDVEPPLLSVICHELNERRRALGQPQITADLVTGNRREILHDFYERSIADLPEAMRTFVEDKLLTKSGFRDNLALETALEEPGVTKELIDTLVSRRLLRIEDRIGTQRVELTHDVLAEVIRASRDTHHQRIAIEQARERERRAHRRMWILGGVAAGLLVMLAGASWSAWRAVRAEREQARLRTAEATLRERAQTQELVARRRAYAADMNGVQHALAADNLGRARDLLYRHRPAPGELDLRGWEWRYLWQFCQSDAQAVLKGDNGNGVLSLTPSRDGKWIAVGGRGAGELLLVHVDTKEEIRVPAGDGGVRVAWSPRESLLAIGIAARRGSLDANSPAYRVLLWDLTNRRVVRVLTITYPCEGLFYSEDGQTLAVLEGVRGEYAVTLWRIADGTKIRSVPFGRIDPPGQFSHFALSRDFGLAAVSHSGATRVKVIDLKTGRERWNAVGTDLLLSALTFSPDGSILASAARGLDTSIRLWDVASGQELGRLEGHRGTISQLVFSSDGKMLVSCSADQTVRVWDVSTRTGLRTFRGHKTEVWRIALLPDRGAIVSGCKDGSAYLWDLNSQPGRLMAGTVGKRVGAWAFAGGGTSVVTINSDGQVARWHGAHFEQMEPLFHAGEHRGAILHPQQPLLAVLSGDGKTRVWNWERRILVREFEHPPTTNVYPHRFSNNGERLAVVFYPTTSYSYREWDIATGRETRSIDVPRAPGQIMRFVVSPDENRLVAVSLNDGDSLDISLTTGISTSIRLNVSEVSSPTFSPDGRRLFVPSSIGYVRILNATTFQPLATLSGYMFGAHSVAFSPDAERFVTGSSAIEAITMWDDHIRERLLTFGVRMAAVGQTAFSPDGNVLGGYSAGVGTLAFWRAPSWAEIEAAERNDGAKASQ